MSWVELERIVSEEILRDDGIWRRGGEDPTEPAVPCESGKVQGVLRYPRVRMSGQVRSVHLTGPSLNTPSRC
jgi:hypothetical protein